MQVIIGNFISYAKGIKTKLTIYRIITGMNTTLGDLAHILEDNHILISKLSNIDEDVEIDGASCDSRHVQPNDIFICKGASFKREFLDSALDKGASCYICDEELSSILSAKHPNIPFLVVRDIRRAMALVSPVAFGNPDRGLTIIGITGTKGKSTVSYMLKKIIDEQQPNHKASLIGSIETYDGIEKFESHNTTPEPPDLQRHLANALKSGHDPLIMEVSSQGLKYDRVSGLDIAFGCFLNIGTDHISPDEHKDFEDYFTSKLKIFDLCRQAVINLDSGQAGRILEAAKESSRCDVIYTVSAKTNEADFWAENIKCSEGKISFTVHTPRWTAPIELSMLGIFNVENALCAIALAFGYGCEQGIIQDGLAKAHVPGRMEYIQTDNPNVKAFIDFAHNELSYQKFFESLAEQFKGYKVISIFGTTGDKAQDRRRELPQVAQNYSDHIIFCEDDPAHEDPYEICKQMASNIDNGCSHEIIVDRGDAIAKAVEMAKLYNEPCVICILGKGNGTWVHKGDKFEEIPTDLELFENAMERL